MDYKGLIYKMLESIDNCDYRLKLIFRFIKKIVGWG